MSGLITFFIQYDPKYVTTGSAEKSSKAFSSMVSPPGGHYKEGEFEAVPH